MNLWDDEVRRKLRPFPQIVKFDPLTSGLIIVLSVVTALFEGIGVGFILPVIELVRTGAGGATSESDALTAFSEVYEVAGVPFTLETVIGGLVLVMGLRYSSSFVVAWLRAKLRADYTVWLQQSAYERALSSEVEFFDERGSDEVLNTVVTQVGIASDLLVKLVRVVESVLIVVVYVAVALYISPGLTVSSVVLLGGVSVLSHRVVESGFDVGERLADANERKHATVQAGLEGIREVKLYGMEDEMRERFDELNEYWRHAQVGLSRNHAVVHNLYQFVTACVVFTLIYVALEVVSLSLGELGVFLFVIFRLSPRISNLNDLVYELNGKLPHLLRTQELLEEMDDARRREQSDGPVPRQIESIRFDGVGFSYASSTDPVLRSIDLEIESGEFVALVGPSGAGKSTIVSLLGRLYTPDEGAVLADDTPVSAMNLAEWRSRVAFVRQDPYVFNDTLRYNLTLGHRDASREQLGRACEAARVDQFLNALPEGYDTVLGDDGVRLSGGQRQRVAIARALLKQDADILVLDEATSDLDSEIESDVQQAIESVDREYTVITVAHRLSTVVNADRIYAVEDGRIVEAGSHGELVENDGVYASLYRSQTDEL